MTLPIHIQGITSFAGFYLTGFYIAHYGIPRFPKKILYGAAFFSWITAFVASTYFSELRNTPNEYFFGNFRPTTFLMAAGVFCYFREKFRDHITYDARFLALSKCMLGVYLIHPLFIKIFYGLQLSILVPHPLITAPLASVLFFILSLATVWVLRKIPGIKEVL